MKTRYTKFELENQEDRFENIFSLPYETDEIPTQLIEMLGVHHAEVVKDLIYREFSLIICLPRFPVKKVLKNAEVIKEDAAFKLVRIPSPDYSTQIEEFLTESEFSVTFLWVKDFQRLNIELPKTSYERIKVSKLQDNEIYALGIEGRTCTVSSWV